VQGTLVCRILESVQTIACDGTAVPMSGTLERRAEQRFSVELACSLRVFDRGRTHATAAIVDLSANGLAVLTSISIAAGTSTVIQQAGFLTFAEVRNCRRDGHAFRIGLRAITSLPPVEPSRPC
jgi:hypothetical protein